MSGHAAERVERIAGLVAFERALMVSVADRIARAASLHTKRVLCRCVWRGASRVRDLRHALPAEAAPIAGESLPSGAVRELIDALGAAPDTGEFCAGLARLVAPVGAAAYAATITGDDGIVGAARLRRAGRSYDLDTAALAGVDAGITSADARRRLGRLAALANGVRGAVRCGEPIGGDPHARSSPALSAPAREHAIRALAAGEAHAEVWFVGSPAEHQQYLHQLIAFEINTFEAVSRHIAEFAWMPWEFHHDMAVQIHDEVAHLEMWLERLAHVGGELGRWTPLSAHEYAVCVGHGLPGRLALLERLIESAALDGLPLHRCMWEARDDSVMVAYLDQVQLDEIGHVRVGNAWLRRLCGDDGGSSRSSSRRRRRRDGVC